eukprot:TRINITY_DN4796_c0_g1_i5.p1 TRINITY_DN4796_c0_g1~~TRINITY_DN4796_c0_g1_i5.p1  ORF type:complete len:209 (-),score=-27.87 TRINITY_DN4796_c0_g1_i5:372-938(-)
MLYLILLLINYALTPQTSQFIFIIFIDTKKLHLLIEKLLDVTINQNKPRIYKHEKQGRHINFNTKIRTTHKYTIMLINTYTTICICKSDFFKLGLQTYLVKMLHHIQSFFFEPILFPFYRPITNSFSILQTYLVKILHHIQSFLFEPILFPFYRPIQLKFSTTFKVFFSNQFFFHFIKHIVKEKLIFV